jgi:hypothetical protein
MRDDEQVPLDELITIERLAEELWCKATSSTEMGWKTLSVLKKQAWRNRARIEVTIWRKKVGSRRQVPSEPGVGVPGPLCYGP